MMLHLYNARQSAPASQVVDKGPYRGPKAQDAKRYRERDQPPQQPVLCSADSVAQQA